MVDSFEKLCRMHEIRGQIIELLTEAEHLVRSQAPEHFPAAEGYWINHIKTALGMEGFKTYSTTMIDSIVEMRNIYERPIDD